MKTQTRPFVVVTKRRRAEADAEAAFLRKSVFRDATAKPVTKEDVRAGLKAR
jgi:hypothetical protein